MRNNCAVHGTIVAPLIVLSQHEMKNYKKIQPEIKITIIYLAMGFVWILFSGNIVFALSADPEDIVLLERIKGWFFIIVTGVLLFMLIRRESDKQNQLMKQLSESKESLLEKSTKLENQNSRLKEFAFITSHNIRKPLANILGLVQLYDLKNQPDAENTSIIKNISEQADELDGIVRDSAKYLTPETTEYEQSK